VDRCSTRPQYAKRCVASDSVYPHPPTPRKRGAGHTPQPPASGGQAIPPNPTASGGLVEGAGGRAGEG
jgi:hypothetical protein